MEAIDYLGRACLRYKRADLANLLNVSEKTITRWKHGATSMPTYILPALREILNSAQLTTVGTGKFTFIDLFAGIGGIRLGFQQHGGQCVFTSEWDKFSQQTYKENFGEDHPIIGDIVPYPAADIPEHDVLLAGFPCQPFSIAGVSKKNALGRPHGFECTTQGTLFFDVARIIAEKRPKAFLLENVKNLRSHDKGKTLKTILDVLRNELGYSVQWRIVNGKHFVPQNRERILIVGFREDIGFNFDALELPAIDNGPRLKDIFHPEDGSEIDVDNGRFIASKGKIHSKYVLTPKLWKYLQNYAEKHRAQGNGFGFGLVTGDDTSRTLSARYYKDGSEVLVSRGGRKRPRRLTPRECARLMGFPDTFKIPVSDTQAYRQFGNSVVVPVVSEVARIMVPRVLELAEEDRRGLSQMKLLTAAA